MPTPQETELKLLIPGLDATEALRRLRRVPALQRRRSQVLELHNRYFDTPALDLQRLRCALRLRQTNGQGWVQTFKTAGLSRGGLSQRGEWEQAVATGQLDAHLLHSTGWAGIDPKGTLLAQLQPCFDTTCRRTVWRVRHRDGTEIEVALDDAEVQAAGQRQPLLELELELISGPTDALFTLAQGIAQHLPVLPSDTSKAERGYRLAAGMAHTPAQASPPALDKHLAPQALAPAVLGEILGQLHRNLDGLCHSDHPEPVHQARVAWRRWRSVSRLLSPWLPPLPNTTGLAPLLHALGRLRDLDVALHHTLPRWAAAYTATPPEGPAGSRAPAWQAAQHSLSTAAQAARSAARAQLAHPDTGAALLRLTAWLHALPTPHRPPDKTWARERLQRWHQRLKHRVRAAQTQPQHWHEARLQAKRLRYASEAVASSLPRALARRATRWTRAAADWQERIGHQRDLEQAAHLLAHLGADPELAGFLRGVAAAHLTPPP